MTILNKPVVRKANVELGWGFGPDSDKRLVAKLVPGRGGIPDMLELKPERTRRIERMALIDIYRLAIRGRVNREVLERARERKAKKAERLATQRAERKLRVPVEQ